MSVDRAGTLSIQVDWGDANNDIGTALVRGRCTVDQILTEVSGCDEAAAIATDDSLNKPSILSTSAQAGDYTLVMANLGPGADTASYRLEGFVSGATAPATSPPVLVPPSQPAYNIDFVSSVPPPGGVIHTGLPDPAASLSASVTTGLAISFTATSPVDRVARLQVVLEGPQNGVCLTNAAPGGVPAAPGFRFQAGVPLTITIRELLLTSVCRYPNAVTSATARLVAASASDPDQTSYEERFALQYTIVE